MSFCPPVDRHVGIGRGGARGKGDGPNPNVEDLLRKLHLTEEEEAVLDLSDEEEEDAMAPVEWALVGKILSPVSIRTETIRMAMKPAWGEPGWAEDHDNRGESRQHVCGGVRELS
jgi:hypothetical protein